MTLTAIAQSDDAKHQIQRAQVAVSNLLVYGSFPDDGQGHLALRQVQTIASALDCLTFDLEDETRRAWADGVAEAMLAKAETG